MAEEKLSALLVWLYNFNFLFLSVVIGSSKGTFSRLMLSRAALFFDAVYIVDAKDGSVGFHF